MGKITSLLVLSVFLLSFLPLVEGSSPRTSQLVQDYNFSEGNNAYWSVVKGMYPKVDNAGRPLQYIFQVAFALRGSGVVIYSTMNTFPTGLYFQNKYDGEWLYLYQWVSIPKGKFLNATLSLNVTVHWGGYVGGLFYGVASQFSPQQIPPSYRWLSLVAYHSGYAFIVKDYGKNATRVRENLNGTHTLSLNLTKYMSSYEGKKLVVMFGIFMYGVPDDNPPLEAPAPNSTTLKSTVSSAPPQHYMLFHWAKFNIKYNPSSSSGSNSGSGGSSSGRGSNWGGVLGVEGYMEMVAHNIELLILIPAGILVSILWVKVAINFFSDDPEKKRRVREDFLLASVGTIIIALAVFGAMWMLAGWITGAVG